MITITQKAKEQLLKLKEEAKLDDTYHLRVDVVAGGCSGLSYKMDFDNKLQVNDVICGEDDFKIWISNKSLLYLMGTEMNFSDGLNGKGFEFTNPNATRSCGCGESFGI